MSIIHHGIVVFLTSHLIVAVENLLLSLSRFKFWMQNPILNLCILLTHSIFATLLERATVRSLNVARQSGSDACDLLDNVSSLFEELVDEKLGFHTNVAVTVRKMEIAG